MANHLYATLIGINAYEQVNALRGCIRDIMRIDSWLVAHCKQENFDYKPAFFLAPHAAEKAVLESYLKTTHHTSNYEPPSFEMLTTKAFDHFANAMAGDVCLFYYSGHGSYIKAPASLTNTGGLQQLETLMPADARTNGRPLVDKELAYLLYKTFNGKQDVHCTLIMDCCHSGNNTREAVKLDEFTYRQAEPVDQEPLAMEKWLGYQNKFYTVKNGKLQFPLARYVQLSACRNHQKAADHPLGGIFSRALGNALNNATRPATYRQLVQQLAVDIAIANGQQNPVAFALHDEDLDRAFLSHEKTQHDKMYRLNWLGDDKGWCLMGGELQGLTKNSKVLIKAGNKSITATVGRVEMNQSTLDAKSWTALDKEKSYEAKLIQLAKTKKTVGLHAALKKENALCKKITDAIKREPPLYYCLEPKATTPDYWMALVNTATGKQLVLVNNQSEVPLFEATPDPELLIKHTEAVCRWYDLVNTKPSASFFDANDFELDAEVITGKKITGETLNNAQGKKQVTHFGDTIEMPYSNGFQPAIRLSITIKNSAPFTNCFIQALHFDNQFGIHAQYIPSDEAALQKGGKLSLSFPIKEYRFDAIPVGLGKNRELLQITEAVHIIRFMVSTDAALDSSHFAQPSLAQSKGEKLLPQPDTLRGATSASGGWSAFDLYLHVTA